MVLAGTLPLIRGLFLFPAQLIAAMCAGGLAQAMVPGDISITNTTLSAGTSIAQGVFIEMFMTAELVFVVLMLAAEKSKDTFIAPVGIGLALFVAMMGGKSNKSLGKLLKMVLIIIPRCLLYWRVTQSRSQLWSSCCFDTICWLPLDLLGWPIPRCCSSCWVLPIREVLRL